MAISGQGQGYDVSMKIGGSYLNTTTSQYCVVGMQANTTTADWTVYRANAGSSLEDTQAAYYAIGVNQTLLSASSTECNVRMHGISKVVCESTVAAGDLLVAYDGISTTTHAGHVVSLSLADETNQTCAAYGMSVAVQYVVIGRALEDGVTNTVISAVINCTPYDRQFWAHS